MNPLRVDEITSLFEGEFFGLSGGTHVSGFSTDHREVREGDLFLAIVGANVDGHTFAADAVAAGAVAVLAERPIDGPHILVEDLVDALAKMASKLRGRFSGPVLGITGSAGKTTTKEFASSALQSLGPVKATEGNRNTEYTSPLLWAEVDDLTKAVVVEMGMRGFGQIAHLARFSQPTIGLITNIGFAHLAQVGSRAGIAQAKGELLEALPETGTAVLWQGDAFLDVLKPKVRSGRIVTFGFTEFADCQILTYEASDWHRARISGRVDSVAWEAEVPAVGRHIALNASAAILAAVVAGVDPVDAAGRIGSAVLAPLRMQILERQGTTIVLDAYNASPSGMIAAIETLAEIPIEGRKRAVVGEMRELGDQSDELHAMVGASLIRHGIEEVLFFGEGAKGAWNECLRLGMLSTQFQIASTIDEVSAFLAKAEKGDVTLVKGSRALALEQALGPLDICQA